MSYLSKLGFDIFVRVFQRTTVMTALKAEAKWFGGVSPPSPNRGTEREQIAEGGEKN